MTETSVWPYDVVTDPRPPDREDPNHVRCFLICPYQPKEIFDDLYQLLEQVCDQIGQQLVAKVECRRSDKIASAGVIHSEMWREIVSADAIIADISGLNPNVLIELGVAAASRKKEHVIILKERVTDEKPMFNLGPVRQIHYDRTCGGYQMLTSQLYQALIESLTSAPAVSQTKAAPLPPFEVNFANESEVDWLVSPSITHRKLTADYLEFGSLFIFRNSWLSVKDLNVSDVEVTAEIKFVELRPDLEGWIGISVRNQHFFANFGHLLYLTSTGRIVRTVPEDDRGNYHDAVIGQIDNFNPISSEYHKFRILADSKKFSMHVDNKGDTFRVADMPYVYPFGGILLQTFRSRMGVQSIRIDVPVK